MKMKKNFSILVTCLLISYLFTLKVKMMGLETEQTPKLHHLVCRNRTNMMLLWLQLQLRHLSFAYIVTKSNIR
jgi:hypothetical protein